jgi:Gluconate 2-dehydrogenase subunit 3
MTVAERYKITHIMQRRRFVQAIPFLYSSPALLAQAIAKLDGAATDAVGRPLPHFFSATQFAALRRLSDLILPAISENPGALEAGAPEFLDFLIGQAPLPTRVVYLSGLDALNAHATAKYSKAFAGLDDTQADALLGPLHEPWTWKEPTEPVALFLRHAKSDILTATMNSREWITATQRNRGSAGNGTYWLPAE